MQFQPRANVGEVSLALVRDRVIFLLVTQRRQLHTDPYSHPLASIFTHAPKISDRYDLKFVMPRKVWIST